MHNPCMPCFLRHLLDFRAFSAERKKLSGQMIVRHSHWNPDRTSCGAFHPETSHCYLARTIYNLHVILQVKPWNSRWKPLIYKKRPVHVEFGHWDCFVQVMVIQASKTAENQQKSGHNDFRKPNVDQLTFNYAEGFFFISLFSKQQKMLLYFCLFKNPSGNKGKQITAGLPLNK